LEGLLAVVGLEVMTKGVRTGSGGHTGGASGAVHQGPRPLGAHQQGPDSNFFEKLISSVSHDAKSQWLLLRDHFLN